MRKRSNSGVRLDYFRRMVKRTILDFQNPLTGLLPATPDSHHAWVRDNVYSSLCVWALALSYRKKADIDEDRAKAYEMEQTVVKIMRGLLRSMMRQVDKVEKFKNTQSPNDCIHAKFDVATGGKCVEDWEWGHLQLDATSLYLLQLAQMTASGIQIITSQDEVTFIQNLVFYIQSSYRIPDYGIWERGDKTNHGVPELNATSIGMARAALEALNGLDVYGSNGGPASVIHVMPDESQQCLTILHSVLPRESNSKETDGGLLSIISYPAFAIDDQDLITLTRNTILEKLKGRYGICRFLRDGYKTAKEDSSRLHYNPWELQMFENIECEWPMFFAYLMLDALFADNQKQVDEYCNALEDIMILREDGLRVVPELYSVPPDKVELEYKNAKSQERVPMGKIPQAWGQSLYVVAKLIKEGFLSPGEIDPLNRRLVAEPKPDIVVQIVVVAEDRRIQSLLEYLDFNIQTLSDIGIQVYPANVLGFLLSHLGQNKKYGLTGRPKDSVGILATSKLYLLQDQLLAFFPQFVDQNQFYLPLDTNLLLDMIKTDVQYLGSNWNMLGRPLMIVPIRSTLLDASGNLQPALISTLRKLQTGYYSGTRVHMALLEDFKSTSCLNDLNFLKNHADSPDLGKLIKFIQKFRNQPIEPQRQLLTNGIGRKKSINTRLRRKSSVRGSLKRSCSIQIDPLDLNDFLKHLQSCSNSGGETTTSSGSTSPNTNPSTSPANIALHDMIRPITQLNVLKTNMAPDQIVSSSLDSKIKFQGIDFKELILQLQDADTLHEQADIIHYLYIHKGKDWITEVNGVECRVLDLLTELYEKAGIGKQWWLIRHTAGMLDKVVEDLDKAASDIIVRQKQLAVGLPPDREKIIIKPLRTVELVEIIKDACKEDMSTAMLTQEIMIYLAMFFRTEPKLFKEMLRIRVGLIIKVMVTELSRSLKCSGSEASDQLLNLSPFELKTLLHHILSGKEFYINTEQLITNEKSTLSIHAPDRMSKQAFASKTRCSIDLMKKELQRQATIEDAKSAYVIPLSTVALQGDDLGEDNDRQGQWLRRRRLDGALNRVPVGFYSGIWSLLKRCLGISFANCSISNNLTSEMTQGELKFAIEVESTMNKIAHPEYRQLCVETMVLLCLIVEHDNGKCHWNENIDIDQLIRCANRIFIDEQKSLEGDVLLCCADPKSFLKCSGLSGICQNFYDCAPSGRYGTMSYISRAIIECLCMPTTLDGNLDCAIQ